MKLPPILGIEHIASSYIHIASYKTKETILKFASIIKHVMELYI